MNEYKELNVGDIAPDFRLPASDGRDISLSNLIGKNVILYFYPKDLTPGCTQQACSFRDEYENFLDLNTVIIGINNDPMDKHHKFISKYYIPFILLSDEDKKVSTIYGVYKEKSMYGKKYMGIERHTFIIDKEGKIVKIFSKVKVKNHIEEVLNFIKERNE